MDSRGRERGGRGGQLDPGAGITLGASAGDISNCSPTHHRHVYLRGDEARFKVKT